MNTPTKNTHGQLDKTSDSTPEHETKTTESASPLQIIYQDEHLVAVYKPAGLLVHRSNVDRHETRFLLQELRNQIGQHLFPVHRLDKPTSGIILFALSSAVASLLQSDMESNKTSKEYLLVCRGYCPEAGTIDHPLKPIDDFQSKHKKKRAAKDKQLIAAGMPPSQPQAEPKPAQHAVTEFRRLDTCELDVQLERYPQSRYSLVLATLLTGRKHQIRRHFKHLSHPLIGCPKYGKSKHNNYFTEHLGASGLLLHAYRLCLTHPITGKTLKLVAEPSGSLQVILERFKWDQAIHSHVNLDKHPHASRSK